MPWNLLNTGKCLQNPGERRPCKGGCNSNSLRGKFATHSTSTMRSKACAAVGSLLRFGKRCLLEKGSFHKCACSRDTREFRDSRDLILENPQIVEKKKRRIRPFSREFRDFGDSRDSSSPDFG